eukprot:gnl/TRDRNA2_/TRDRNA2_152320_c0_seq2.p1 gnl/TRDRNA2_/TRDRNA2_152320_c0~~gnl/TRDRNA2_/TRDRNA2_152320_c0_seq2.p1  ORF type:complete len:131 (+),score=22.52 gnl/TRDRNA2_/TRDRNA2_152320_c0_seq2:104-496(+)
MMIQEGALQNGGVQTGAHQNGAHQNGDHQNNVVNGLKASMLSGSQQSMQSSRSPVDEHASLEPSPPLEQRRASTASRSSLGGILNQARQSIPSMPNPVSKVMQNPRGNQRAANLAAARVRAAQAAAAKGE